MSHVTQPWINFFFFVFNFEPLLISLLRSGKFESLCNKEMVTLEPVVKDIDVSFLQEHLKEFISYTGSEVAQAILTNWQDHVKYFVKVRYKFHVYV